jgi:hypothetical protein
MPCDQKASWTASSRLYCNAQICRCNFFDFFIFCQLAWAIFFNFVPTKSGRQGELLGFSEKVEIKWTGRYARFIFKTTFSDEQGDLLGLFHTH